MSEKNLCKAVMKHLKGRHPFRVENPCLPGTPDIAYVGGWIECKYLAKMPKSGIAKIRHWRPEQAAFAKAHEAAGGIVYLIAQVGKWFYIGYASCFDGTIYRIHCWPTLKDAMMSCGLCGV